MNYDRTFICMRCRTLVRLEKATNNYYREGAEQIEIIPDNLYKCPICGAVMNWAPTHDIKYDLCDILDVKEELEEKANKVRAEREKIIKAMKTEAK